MIRSKQKSLGDLSALNVSEREAYGNKMKVQRGKWKIYVELKVGGGDGGGKGEGPELR